MSNSLAGVSSTLLLLTLLPVHAQDSRAPSSEHLKHVNFYDLPWTGDPGIPLSHVARWKTLLGSGGILGEGLPDKDMYIRQGEMGQAILLSLLNQCGWGGRTAQQGVVGMDFEMCQEAPFCQAEPGNSPTHGDRLMIVQGFDQG